MEPRPTRWRPFPDPRKGEMLVAPIGPGVYELRNRMTKQLLLVGIGVRCAHRMCSILPAPLGCGTRNNSRKRDYVGRHLADVEYRTIACESREHARQIEKRLLAENEYRFRT